MSEQIDTEKYCKYCESAVPLTDGDQMLCSRHGVVPASHLCGKFRYDPLKRTPKRSKQEPHLEYVNVD